MLPARRVAIGRGTSVRMITGHVKQPRQRAGGERMANLALRAYSYAAQAGIWKETGSNCLNAECNTARDQPAGARRQRDSIALTPMRPSRGR